MLDHHGRFLGREKATKARVVGLCGRMYDWDLSTPFDTLDAREELRHELRLTGQFDSDSSISDASLLSPLPAREVLVDGVASLGVVSHLYVAVHRLAIVSVEHEMDGLERGTSWLDSDIGHAT